MMLLCLGKKTTSAATIGSIPFISITQKKKKKMLKQKLNNVR